MVYIHEKTIHQEELSELDFDLLDKFVDTDSDYDYEMIYSGVDNGYYNPDGTPIEIDKLISFLQTLKEKGANYVSMESHCDHHGYAFAGLKIEEVDEETIKKHEEFKKEKELRKEKILKLEEEIRKIENQ